MTNALTWYINCNGDKQRLINIISINNYNHKILIDYKHILINHILNDQLKNMKNNRDCKPVWKTIYNKNLIGECNENACNGLKRYHSKLRRSNKITGNKHQMYIDSMDFLHCYLMHSNY